MSNIKDDTAPCAKTDAAPPLDDPAPTEAAPPARPRKDHGAYRLARTVAISDRQRAARPRDPILVLQRKPLAASL